MVAKIYKLYPDPRPMYKDSIKYVVIEGNAWSVFHTYTKKANAVKGANSVRDWNRQTAKSWHGKGAKPSMFRVVKTVKGWAVVQQSPSKTYQLPKSWLIDGKL